MNQLFLNPNTIAPTWTIYIQASPDCSPAVLETAITTDTTCATKDRDHCLHDETTTPSNKPCQTTGALTDACAKTSKRVYKWQRNPKDRNLTEEDARSIMKAIKCRKQRISYQEKYNKMKELVEDQKQKQDEKDQKYEARIKELEDKIIELQLSNCQVCSLFESL